MSKNITLQNRKRTKELNPGQSHHDNVRKKKEALAAMRETEQPKQMKPSVDTDPVNEWVLDLEKRHADMKKAGTKQMRRYSPHMLKQFILNEISAHINQYARQLREKKGMMRDERIKIACENRLNTLSQRLRAVGIYVHKLSLTERKIEPAGAE